MITPPSKSIQNYNYPQSPVSKILRAEDTTVHCTFQSYFTRNLLRACHRARSFS